MIERYTRQRNFKPAEYGSRPWWLLGLSQNGATARGVEIIEIVEIVETKTLGSVAFYRQWISDPDGTEYHDKLLPHQRATINFRAESRLRQDLKRMGMENGTTGR